MTEETGTPSAQDPTPSNPPMQPAPPAPADPHPAPKAFTPRLVLGIAIIVVGLLMTLDNLVPDQQLFRTAFKLWPAVLIVMGFAKLRSEPGDNPGGWLLVAGGAFGLLVTFGYRRFEDFILPGLLLAAGIFIVTKALKQHRGVPPELQSSSAFLACTSIFSGCKRRPLGPLRGAEMTAIFGGFELDLRQAQAEFPTTRVDVFVLFGGGEIRVPEGWEVRNQALAVFGGIHDRTPPQALGSGRPVLLLTGLALFGGVELKP